MCRVVAAGGLLVGGGENKKKDGNINNNNIYYLSLNKKLNMKIDNVVKKQQRKRNCREVLHSRYHRRAPRARPLQRDKNSFKINDSTFVLLLSAPGFSVMLFENQSFRFRARIDEV